MPVDETATRLAAMKLRRDELELAVLEEQVGKMRSDALKREQDYIRQEREIAETARQEAMRQAICKHRKGGKDKAGLVNGNDSNYSIIVNTYPMGNVEIMCQRCQKLWVEPAASLRKTDPKLYATLKAEYLEARSLTTDNAPSGKRLFALDAA